MNFLSRKPKVVVKESKKKQTYLGPLVKTCPDCLMTFSINASDLKLHDKFHSNVLNGIPLALNGNPVFQTLVDSTFKIVKILKSLSLPSKVFEILSIVDNALGVNFQDQDHNLIIYFYLEKNRVVGVLVLEKITFGHFTYEITNDQDIGRLGLLMCGSAYFLPKVIECSYGVNRIWVSKSKRRFGIATKLLEIALDNVSCPKSQVAFSQPSEAGKKLAISFTQRKDFLIY